MHIDQSLNRKRKNFLELEAPLGYVGGIGRGAQGFTTRSDIGPARIATDTTEEENPKRAKIEDFEDNENLNEVNYNEFSGYGGSICSKDPYEKDDEEADEIFHAIDNRMDERRKDQREQNHKQNLKQQPKVQHVFSDIKGTMKHVTKEQWNDIPEAGDARNKKERNPRPERFTPLPDSVLNVRLNMDKNVSSIDPRTNGGMTPLISGTMTQAGNINVSRFGEARKNLMLSRLSQVSDSATDRSVINYAGYLTELQSTTPKMLGEVSDVKKTRAMLSNLCKANPTDYRNWISYAVFEEADGKLKSARKVIMEGCDNCPTDEEIWLKAARLYSGNESKQLIAKAINNIPCSVRLYMEAAEMETRINDKKQILRKALTNISNSVGLWKTAIELETEEYAKLMLKQATECCPHHYEFWLALSKLQTIEEAKNTLNKAINKLPNEKKIWIAAAQLEESHGNVVKVNSIIKKALSSMEMNNVEIKREEWHEEAKIVEKTEHSKTCEAILVNVASIDVQDERETWLSDAEGFQNSNYVICARSMYNIALRTYPENVESWYKAISFEKIHGTTDSFEEILERAVAMLPKECEIWLMAAKAKWRKGDVPGTRIILEEAFEKNENDEDIWLAAAKLETEINEHENAQILLGKARNALKCESIYMKSVKLEWCLGNMDEAKKLLLQSLDLFPKFAKFWMMKGQIEEQSENNEAAKESYQKGLKYCPNSIPLWMLLTKLEERNGNVIKARAILDKAKTSNFKNPLIWLEMVRFENRNNNKSAAINIMSRSLREFKDDGQLWAEAIFMEPCRKRKAKNLDALKGRDNDIFIVLASAKYLWSEGKIDKARKWFENVILIDQRAPEDDNPKKVYGDAYAFYYKFECLHGTEETREKVKALCVKAEPNSGEYWCKVSKDIKNWKLKIDEILLLVAKAVHVPE